jgi:hypothetical protein
MLKIINQISLALFLVAVPFLFYGFGTTTIQIVSKSSFGNSRWMAFLLGAAVFFPCLIIAKRLFHSGWCYLETLEHELTHLLIGLLFLKIPTGIRVSAHEGGEVRQIGLGTTGQIWVTLAPYFFPTLSATVLIFAYFVNFNSLLLLSILGWTTAFHLITNWGETSFRQPDLQKAGILKTILILPVMNLISYGSILAFVANENKGFSKFYFEGISQSFHLVVKILESLIK